MDDIDEDEEDDDNENESELDEDDEEDENDDEEDEDNESEEDDDDEEEQVVTQSKGKSTSVSPSKIYPEAADNSSSNKNNSNSVATPVRSPPSLKTQDMTEDDLSSAQETFNMLNSPLDSMLLLRKRNSQHAHPLPQTHALSPTPLHTNYSDNEKTNSNSKVKPPAAPLSSSPLANKEVQSPPKPPTPSHK